MVALLLGSLVGCKAPPDAPEGLDDSVQFLMRDFYGDDETVSAGLTGLLAWFDAEGGELLDQKANLDSVGAFSLTPLTPEVVADLPVEGAPDPALADGVVSVSQMACDWKAAERLLVRADQDVVFEGDFDTYARDFVTDRAAFEGAARSGELPPLKDALDPAALGDTDAGALLVTENQAQSTTLGVTVPFDLVLHFRHGVYDIGGDEAHAFLILGWFPHEAVSDGGDSRMVQNYSLEVNVERGGETLRVFGNWTELDTPFADSDSAIVKSSAVNKSQDSAERLSKICAGDEDIPAE